MAKNKIAGLTVEIGGDTTELGKALENVNQKSKDLSSELGQVNRLLRMDPGNADLLAQKQQILSDAVENTEEKLKKLKEAERQVQEQFERGEVSVEQVRELQREIADTENKLDSYKSAVKETADEVANLGKESKASADELNAIANTGFKALGLTVGAAVTGLTAAAETTRAYRTEMGKLDTAFTDNGHSSETALEAYRELQGYLGETEQAVEAANHLALLTDNEKDLATWTGDILPGIFATFGSSLPLEGLTEAANHTAKLGEVQGPLADALEWAGITTDSFNESLAKCSTEQERQQLIMETLNGIYGEASQAYKETNKDVIAANQANERMAAAMAEVGAAVEPLLTKVKDIGATLMTNIVPVIETILNNLPTVAIALAGITAALVSYKVAALAATAAEKGMTLAQYAAATAQKVLNAAMSANPIGLVILAITALVAAFTYLWQNSEEFREFWIELWEKIKETAAKVAEWFKELPGKIKNAIWSAITRVQEWGNNLTNAVKNAATNMLNRAKETLAAMPGRVRDAIAGAINSVASWGTNMINKAKTAMSNVVSSVTSTLKELPSKVLSIGADLVAGLWNGVNNKLTWLKNKIKSFTSSVLGSIKSFFGVHSPSTEMAWIGDMLDQGLAEGMIDNMSDPVKAAERVSTGVLDAAQNVDGIALGRSLQVSQTAQTAAASGASSMGAKLDAILAAIERGQVLTIDKAALIGATADSYDNTLGQRRALVARGAL